MNPFFAYLIKSSVSLMLLYCLFRVSMRNDRNHAINRFLLLGILLVSAIIPFLNIQFFYEEIPLKPVETIREFVSTPVFTEPVSTETVQPIIEMASSSVNHWLAFYLLIISALVFRLVLGVIKVMQIISRAEKRRLQKIVLAVVQDIIQPFTFLNKVVLSEKDFTENKHIVVAHEHAHIKQLHTIDLMVCEVFTVMHFFNPFMWLLRHDLKLIHEYQADQAVLNKGIDAQKYQLLVLQKSVGERRFAMANHFTQKPILKRLKMMQKKNRKQWAALKLILFVPLVVLLLMAFSKPGEKILEKTKVIEKITTPNETVTIQTEYEGLSIEIRKDGNYIDNKSCSIEELATKAKTFQKTGREDILLILDRAISLDRIDEVREALRKAKVYHVNQTTVGSDEIIYPHGDVSKSAKFTQGKWENWWRSQLKSHIKDIPEGLEYQIFFGFIIDKNGKVSDAHIIKGCDTPEINEAYKKALAQIPDYWEPAKKGNTVISIYKTEMDVRKVR